MLSYLESLVEQYKNQENIVVSFVNGEDNTSVSGKDYKTIQYNKIVPLLVQTIKELESRIKTLEDA